MTPTDTIIQVTLAKAVAAKYGVEVRASSAKLWCARAYNLRKRLNLDKLNALRFVLSPDDPQHTIWVVNTDQTPKETP